MDRFVRGKCMTDRKIQQGARLFNIFRQLTAAAVTGVLFTNSAGAENSKDFAVMARESWSAFECSSLASVSSNAKEQERLFLFGYDQGKKFIAALQAQKIEEEDLSTEAPLMVLFLLQGPTPDFMLGRIFEAAQNSALKDVFGSGRDYNPEDLQKSIADGRFWKDNCQLIGKQR